MSLLPIVLRCNVKNTGDAEYPHQDITCLMALSWVNNANKSLASGKLVANSLTLTPSISWIGETAGCDISERANHNNSYLPEAKPGGLVDCMASRRPV